MDAARRQAVALGGGHAGVEQDLVGEARGQGVLGVGRGLAFASGLLFVDAPRVVGGRVVAAAPAHAECGCLGAFALLCQGRTPCRRDQGVTAPSDNVADPVAGGYAARLDL